MDDDVITNPVEGQQGNDNDLDLLEEIKNLKANTVSKEDYIKLQEKNKNLMRQIINGGGTSGEAEDTVDLQEIRKNIFEKNENLSNRDFWKNVLALRKERLEKEGVDVFLPKGRKTRYSKEDIESANHVAEVIGQILEDSEDNPAVFTALLNNAID